MNGKADFDQDRLVHRSELETYVKRRVVKLTRGRQHPITLSPTAIPDFALVAVP